MRRRIDCDVGSRGVTAEQAERMIALLERLVCIAEAQAWRDGLEIHAEPWMATAATP